MKFSIVLLFFLFIHISSAKEYKQDFNHTFSVEKGVTVVLNNGDGDVNITPWDKDEIKVNVVYHINSKSKRDDDTDFDVEFRQDEDRVYIIAHENRRNMFGFFSLQYIDYHYEISVPSYVNFDIHGDDGDIDIRDITGNINCKTSDGDMVLKNIDNETTDIKTSDGDVNISSLKGELTVRGSDGKVTLENADITEGDISTSDGRIRIRDSKGNFYVDSDDGDVSLVNIAGEKLNVKTQDGDVDIFFTGQDEIQMGVFTNDGSVNIEFKNPVSAQFALETDDGRIRFDVDKANVFSEGKRYVTGDLGDGNGKIKIRTGDGSITVYGSY